MVQAMWLFFDLDQTTPAEFGYEIERRHRGLNGPG